MRALIAGALFALFVSPSFAQQVRECPADVSIVGPGALVPSGAIPGFRWNAEPAGTASREVVVFSADNPNKQQVGKVAAFGGGLQVADGEYGWFVTFKNAAGVPICRTAVAMLQVGGESRYAGGGGLTSPGGFAPSKIILNAAGRYVIVLRNSRYAGDYSVRIDADDFDGTSFALNNASGLEIHGNELANKVTGSPKSDLIVLYGGDDEAEGGPGDDALHGGNGDDTLTDIAAGAPDVDVLFGGPGNDSFLDTRDGDSQDTHYPGANGGTGAGDPADPFDFDTSVNGIF